MISIKLNMRAMPAPRPRVTRRGTYNPERYTNYKKAMQIYFRPFKKFEAPKGLRIEVAFFLIPPKTLKGRKYPFPNFDVDNALKGVLDAGNGILWDDDLQICEAIVTKKYADVDAIFIQITEL